MSRRSRHPVAGAAASNGSAADLIEGFEPENDLEARVTVDPGLLRGLSWGRPRHGHPEGSVGRHVADLLAQIDRLGERGALRAELRFIALVHDSLKYQERDWLPHVGPNHHAVRARRLAERYTSDERLLAAIELHDRPYHLWRRTRRPGGRLGRRITRRALQRLLDRIPDLELFARFVDLDASTEGKNPEPRRWFREELARRGLIAPGVGLQTARQSCSAATGAPLRVRRRPAPARAPRGAGRPGKGMRRPPWPPAGAAAEEPMRWAGEEPMRLPCRRAAAGVAAGISPAAPPATPTRTAARPARGSPAPPSRGAWPGASTGALGAPGVGDTLRRYSPSVENSTTRSSAVPICSLNRGNMRS